MLGGVDRESANYTSPTCRLVARLSVVRGLRRRNLLARIGLQRFPDKLFESTTTGAPTPGIEKRLRRRQPINRSDH
ncbi:hypothetical protein MMAN_54840 [Mycobacterium mantenii]|uniref:Uncharacterized protein n=1 Tax=Mycobacterium mantenii TaxID=560555 RepID=A0ABM7K0H1_MYCNT|nr:hypothetical protein MMAN_54840 [Mycobacterium mantenii]